MRIFTTLIILSVLFFLVSCQHGPSGISKDVGIEVMVSGNGWHTGIVIPQGALLKEELPFISKDLPDAGYYEIGWGDADYYQTIGPSFWMGLKGAFWPTDSVLHVTGLRHDPLEFFGSENLVKVKITEKISFYHLMAFSIF